MTEQEVSISIVMDREDATSLSDQIEAQRLRHGQSVEEMTGLVDPITISVIVIGAVFSIAELIRWIIFTTGGGATIDLTKDPPACRKEKALPSGTFLIIAKDGNHELLTKDMPASNLGDILKAILSAGKDATIETIKETIKAASPKPTGPVSEDALPA